MRAVNAPLRRGCTPRAPHPLAATIGHLLGALKALRATIPELPDKGKGGLLYRGLRAFEVGDDFLERGGVELGFGCVTNERAAALTDAMRGGADAVVLLKLRVVTPAADETRDPQGLHLAEGLTRSQGIVH